ncbi:MAG: alpha/beta hydrolase [Gaiellales bacterium]|nr:alpha/beta hydrolase [Gaiellales bacterium]
MPETFVLVHGAWHGGWVWDGVVKELEAAGHKALAPTLAGMAPGDDRAKVTFDAIIDSLATVLAAQSEPVVLVGHSSAGFVLQTVAARVPEKLKRIVFLNAFILPDGTCQFDLVPPEASQGMTVAAQASPDNCVPVIEEFVRDQLMPGDSKEAQDALLARLSPQPLALFTTPINARAFAQVNVPKTVVFCRDDASLPPGAFQGMVQALGECRVIEIPGGHELLFIDPTAVAKALLEAVA